MHGGILKIKEGKLLTVRERDETPIETARRTAYKAKMLGLGPAALERYAREVILPAYDLPLSALNRVIGARYDVAALKRTPLDGYMDISRAKRVKQNEWHMPCPKCGGDDRFALKRTPDGDLTFCRQCTGAKWMDAIDFMQWLYGIDFRAACQRLGATTRIEPPRAPVKREEGTTYLNGAKNAVKRCARSDKAFPYLAKRGISDTIAIAARIGWSDKWPGIVIPCFDAPYNANLRYVKIRKPNGQYRHVKGGKPYPFTLRGGIARDDRPVLLVENELDALALESVWRRSPTDPVHLQIIALGGAGLCRQFDLPARRYDAFDNDDAGREASAFWGSKRLMDRFDANDPGDLSTAQKWSLLCD